MLYNFRKIRNAITGVEACEFSFLTNLGWTSAKVSRILNEPEWQGFLSEMRTEANRANDTPVTALPFSVFQRFEIDGDRQTYEMPYFDRRGRLVALALASLIDESSDYLETLQDLIWEVCNEYTWCLPASLLLDFEKTGVQHRSPPQIVDLFAAETADTLAEILAILGKKFNPRLNQRVCAEIERRVFQPLFNEAVPFWWESSTNNWASVCAGSVGMAALLLVEDRERLAGMIDRVIRAMECYLEGFGNDGGCAEGIMYWNYGFGYYVYFADMLYSYTGGKLDLLQSEKVRHIAEFPAGVNLSDEIFVNFSDSQAYNVLAPGLLSKLTHRFRIAVPELNSVPAFHNDHCYRWAAITRNLLWTDTSLFHQRPLEGTTFFPDMSWLIDRRYAGRTVLAFSAKGGHNGESHNHNDLGHFILHIGGESLLADLGAGLYSRQYFGPERYSILNNSSQGHSVPLINSQVQKAGSQYKARVNRYDCQEKEITFELDLTEAYDSQAAELLRFTRTFLWNYEAGETMARLELQDEFHFLSELTNLVENFISFHQPDLDAVKGTVSWQAEKGRVEMLYAVEEFEANLEILGVQDHAGNLLPAYRLGLKAIKPAKEQIVRFTFNLLVQA